MGNISERLFDYTFSPLFFLLLLASVIGIGTTLFLSRIPKTTGVKYLIGYSVASAVWAITYAFEFAANNIDLKIFWSKLSYLGIVFCPVTFFFFAMAFSSRKKQLGAIYQVVLWSLSGLFLSMVLTNDLHHLHWVAYSVNTQTHATNYEYGPLFWLFFVFTYVLLFAGNISLIQLYFRLTTFYRSQITLTLIAAVLPLLGNLIYVFHVNPIPGFDWTPFLFLISDFLMAINILRFKAFDLVPFARNKLIDIMPDGIMITDSSGRIIDLNPALVAFSGKTESEMIGKKIEEVFPARQNFIDEMKEKHDRFDCSFSENTEGVDSFFDVSVTPLHSNTGTVDGHLIQVKEVTRRVEAERQIQDANRHLMAEIQEKEKLIADLNAFSHMVATI